MRLPTVKSSCAGLIRIAAAVMLLLLLLLPTVVMSIDNGLGQTPPKGWRSWNYFLATNNQSVMEAQMRAAVDKSRTVDGVPTSLAELGWDLVAMDGTADQLCTLGWPCLVSGACRAPGSRFLLVSAVPESCL